MQSNPLLVVLYSEDKIVRGDREMLCDKCGQHAATVKFVQIENDHKTELHLCQSCAQGYTNFSTGFDLQHLLPSMFQAGKLGQKLKQGPAVKTCSMRRSLLDIQRQVDWVQRCYQVFRMLNPKAQVHGSVP